MDLYLTPEHFKTAKNNGIPYGTLYARFYSYGWDAEKAITEPVKDPHVSGWKERKHIAAENGVSYQTYHYRVQIGGWDKDEAACTPTKTKKECMKIALSAKKRLFTQEQLKRAEANGIKYQTLYKRVRIHKWDVERAINTPTLSKDEVCQIARKAPGSFQNNQMYLRRIIE